MNFNERQTEALKDLLYRMADDELIIGHRNSEWTGLGPILEEDIAFSSMAQDKIGHAQHYFELLHSLGEPEPDKNAFTRDEKDLRCCHFVEYPIGEYDFSLMRHFLFDHAMFIRYELLLNSSYEPLAQAMRKFKGEMIYHTLHADTWIKQLGQGNEESKHRMQSSLIECMPLALGIFEQTGFDDDLKSAGIFDGEDVTKQLWLNKIIPLLENSGYTVPDIDTIQPAYGGRKGYHTEYLKPLLDEMTEVFRIDPNAEW